MASDGNIEPREIALIKSLCAESSLFENFNFEDEINILIAKVNSNGKEFIRDYFELLKVSSLSEQEELTVIDFVIKIIKADEQIEYSEIKFFKNIRHRLNINDEKILAAYPEIEQFLEEDIITESFLDKITKQYLDSAELPQFNLLSAIDHKSLADLDNDE